MTRQSLPVPPLTTARTDIPAAEILLRAWEETTRLTRSSGPFGKKGPATAQQKKPRRQLDDNNFRQLMNIASGQLSLLGVIFFIMIALNFLLKQFDLLHAHRRCLRRGLYGRQRHPVGLQSIGCAGPVRRGDCGPSYPQETVQEDPDHSGHHDHHRSRRHRRRLSGAELHRISGRDQQKEAQYLERNIEYTQYAYQLNDVEEKSFAADNNLTSEDIVNNPETINNIRINDYQPVNTFYNQTQSIRQYYKFNDVDVDRYMIDGELTQTYLSTQRDRRGEDQPDLAQQTFEIHSRLRHHPVPRGLRDSQRTAGRADQKYSA